MRTWKVIVSDLTKIKVELIIFSVIFLLFSVFVGVKFGAILTGVAVLNFVIERLYGLSKEKKLYNEIDEMINNKLSTVKNGKFS